eukprot:scaffold28403_cov112-Isochrysis_galbana.AAC.2
MAMLSASSYEMKPAPSLARYGTLLTLFQWRVPIGEHARLPRAGQGGGRRAVLCSRAAPAAAVGGKAEH